MFWDKSDHFFGSVSEFLIINPIKSIFGTRYLHEFEPTTHFDGFLLDLSGMDVLFPLFWRIPNVLTKEFLKLHFCLLKSFTVLPPSCSTTSWRCIRTTWQGRGQCFHLHLEYCLYDFWTISYHENLHQISIIRGREKGSLQGTKNI